MTAAALSSTPTAARIVVQTRRASLDAVARFAGPDRDVAVVEPEALAVLAEHDPFVRHFTVAHAGAGGGDAQLLGRSVTGT